MGRIAELLKDNIVNKYIGATLSFNLRYNDLEVGHLQTQHGIGIGLNYKL